MADGPGILNKLNEVIRSKDVILQAQGGAARAGGTEDVYYPSPFNNVDHRFKGAFLLRGTASASGRRRQGKIKTHF